MLDVVTECVRVSKGLVLINCAGVTRDWCYQPGPEGLLYEWWKRGGRCWRPAFWHRVGIPGSGGKQWLRADVEYVLAFTKCEKMLPWADNTANGHPPKRNPGGDMSYRTADGERVNGWHAQFAGGNGSRGQGRKQNGEKCPKDRLVTGKKKAVRRCTRGKSGGDTIQEDAYLPPVLANPGVKVDLHETRDEMIERWLATVESSTCIDDIKVGGGLMGAPEAHENEAPFPLKLAQWFIRGWCPPGGKVLDPFSGSGTTVHAAMTIGRVGIGCDLRFSQCELGRRRCRNVQVEMFQ